MKKFVQLYCLLFTLIGIAAFALALRGYGVRINFTSSMPIGIYLKSSASNIAKGDIVSVCLPVDIAEAGIARGYLSHGSCPESHAMPVLKQIIAVPGDNVEYQIGSIVVNQKRYSSPIIEKGFTGAGYLHLISQQTHGITVRYWLYGDNNKSRSWDSRYYGGVKRDEIQGVFKPLWIF